MQLPVVSNTTGSIINRTPLPALQNPRILARVFEHLVPSVDPYSSDPIRSTKRDLLRAALTCKIFRDPALDIIWRSLDTFVPLLKLIPSIKLINKFYVFYRAVEESDWDRFDANAWRVKEFILSKDSDFFVVAQSTFVQLAQFRPQPLPSLQKILCKAPQSLARWPLLIQQTLTHVEIEGFTLEHTHIIEPFIATLALSSEFMSIKLKHLALRGQLASPASLDQLVHFANLQCLEILSDIDLERLEQIGSLQFLRNLTVTLSDSITDLGGGIGFTGLKELHVTGGFSSIQLMLETIATPHLEAVSITAIWVPPPLKKSMKMKKGIASSSLRDHWCKAFFTILNSRWSSSLLAIYVRLDESKHIFNVPVSQPLFSDLPRFTRLESLDFNTHRFAQFDGEIRDLAAACPRLKELRLAVPLHGDSEIPYPNMTIETLWALAELCPNLTFLQINLNINHIPGFRPDKVFSHGLCDLSVGCTCGLPIMPSTLLHIGRHIDRLFPYVKNIHTHKDCLKSDWKYISELLQTFQDIRVDETTRRSHSGHSFQTSCLQPPDNEAS